MLATENARLANFAMNNSVTFYGAAQEWRKGAKHPDCDDRAMYWRQARGCVEAARLEARRAVNLAARP